MASSVLPGVVYGVVTSISLKNEGILGSPRVT